jgi:hypothetical protein
VGRGAVPQTAETGEFHALSLRDRRVVAGMKVDAGDASEHLQALLRSPQSIDAAALATPTRR